MELWSKDNVTFDLLDVINATFKWLVSFLSLHFFAFDKSCENRDEHDMRYGAGGNEPRRHHHHLHHHHHSAPAPLRSSRIKTIKSIYKSGEPGHSLQIEILERIYLLEKIRWHYQSKYSKMFSI